MTESQAYKNYCQARTALLASMNEGNSALAREYYRSKTRPLDEHFKNEVRGISAEMYKAANPKGTQKRLLLSELLVAVNGWSKKLSELK